MSTKEYYEGVIEDVLAELGFPTDDEAAMSALMEKVSRSHDDLATKLDEYVCAEARRLLAPIALSLMEAGEALRPVPAHVDYQVWVSDYAHDIGTASFDARRALDWLPLGFVECLDALVADDGTAEVVRTASDLGLCDPHDGPFSCYIDDAESLASYVAARRAAEGRS